MNKHALLVIQLGSPASPAVTDVKSYLKSFLSDPRLVKQSLFWKILLNRVILPRRSPTVAAKYASIALGEGHSMPLHYYTEEFTRGLRDVLGERYDLVLHAFVHGREPLVKSALKEMQREGITHIKVIPLYPQFAEAMTLSAKDACEQGLKKLKMTARVEYIESFYQCDAYLNSLAQLINQRVAGASIQKLLFSFHGYPVKKIEAGDPYYAHCTQTVALLKERIALSPEDCITCFQSKFGPGEWLSPATDDVIRGLTEQGITRIAVCSPSFVADNLETLEEIGIEYRELFMKRGGVYFDLVPSLNSDPDWIAAFAKELC